MRVITLGAGAGRSLVFERELRVTGERAAVGPTLDAAYDCGAGSIAFEVKTASRGAGSA